MGIPALPELNASGAHRALKYSDLALCLVPLLNILVFSGMTVLCSTPPAFGPLSKSRWQLQLTSSEASMRTQTCGLSQLPSTFCRAVRVTMSCHPGLLSACHMLYREHGLVDPGLILQSRGPGLPLTSLKAWHIGQCAQCRPFRQTIPHAAAQDRADGKGNLAETLLSSVTATLAAGLEVASIATDSLARLQRVVGPLPTGFPPGEPHSMHG